MSTRDMRGVLVCCQLNRRRECTANMIEWFADVADSLFPPPAAAHAANEDEDGQERGRDGAGQATVADELERELAELKEEAAADRALGKKRARGVGGASKRFCVQRQVTHAGSIFFIESTDPAVDVVRLCEEVVRGVIERGDLRCRYAVRLCPVEATCFASVSALEQMAAPLLARRMPGLGGSVKTFAVRWFRRAENETVQKDALIRTAAQAALPGFSVDLKRPAVDLLLQLLGRRICLAVVDSYADLCTYNLQTAMSTHGKKSSSSSSSKG